ncbi:MAG TPA: xanthine dehydrogenase family protein molybdopterin-binding subunit [Firmicutes bacterium]|jgi:CO/xanthine dehydrogenase Mo-binding subunit|nr:xanthine dehydrogenase family protein molybdopterin-binding subunit [Bacillota bacterium]
MNTVGIGISIPKKESNDKVTGRAKYNTDHIRPELLHAWMVTSIYAHARIKSIDLAKAYKITGVRAIVTGDSCPILCGPAIEDWSPLARGKVRYFGEPIAVVVGDSEAIAKEAAGLVQVEYEPLPVVNSPAQAFQADSPKVHEDLAIYEIVQAGTIFPQPGTNILQHVKVKKGDLQKGWQESEVVVEASYSLPQANHIAMEPRNARAEIKPDGQVIIDSSTQGPFNIQKFISKYFKLDNSKVTVRAPLVGGGFGGKTTVHVEFIAYLASRAVGGRPVKLVESREQDMTSSPCMLGLQASIKLGAAKDGTLKAGEFTLITDVGAYCDSGSEMARGMAADCSGPYRLDNLHCDAYSVYTNHTFVTAFRSFSRLSSTFALERTMDKLAFALGMDPLELRKKNALRPGDTSPTMVRLNKNNFGNLEACLEKLKTLINWDEGVRVELGNGKVRAKGAACLWKTSSSSPNAHSSAIIIINDDGTLNLSVGAVEIGPGSKTCLAQILAEKLRMDVNKIHVIMEVDTSASPHHWKTVASMTNYMVGNAVLEAARDFIRQLKTIGGIVLKCPAEMLEVGSGRVYLREDPEIFVDIKEIGSGYQYPEGNAIGGQIIGRGNFIMPHLLPMDPSTGRGRLGPAWAVGAQAVEVEFNQRDFSYKIVRAATVMDAGKVLNPKGARGVVMGGMSMGLGYGSREAAKYSTGGQRENPQLRTYHLLRLGENPQYLVEFVETPDINGPYGMRGIAEHGIIGIPAALANALSAAAQADLDCPPLTPQAIWQACKGAGK